MQKSQIVAVGQALLAALLFGASAPLSKLLLGDIEPIPLAALLYLGSGIGIWLVQRLIAARHPNASREAALEREDYKWLLGAIVAGGVAAPITLLFSLRVTPAATASLLLNFEAVATTLIALVVFREAISARAWVAIVMIMLASILLSTDPTAGWGFSMGALGVLAACVLWGVDNNLIRHISAKDPLVIVAVKGIGAGLVSSVLALLLGNRFPPVSAIGGAMLLGLLSYGLSIVLFIYAMRALGAARTSALFGTAPLAGVLLSILIFHDQPTVVLGIALPLTLLGAFALVSEDHEHHHTHEWLLHDHAHSHSDDHHDHEHDIPFSGRRHSHPHEHRKSTHSHHHLPDIHHRHAHSSE